jgi:hypothetical protein
MIASKRLGGSARRWTGVAAFVALAMMGAARVPAAERTDLHTGTWVRLHTEQGTTLQGALRSMDEKRLILERPGKDPVQVPRDSVSRLDVRRRASKKGLGFAVGLLGGAAIGYAIGAATSGPGCRGDEIWFENLCSLDDIGKPVGLIFGGAAGALLGLVAAPGAKWERDLALGRVHVGIGPRRHRGIGLSLSVAF